LFLAAYNGNKEIVEILISGGADVNVKNNDGKTPLTIAGEEGYTEIVNLLLENGAKE